MVERELGEHQIYLLQVMLLPADVQINQYRWDSFDVGAGIAHDWATVFTGWLLVGEPDELLPNMPHEVKEIDEMRLQAMRENWDVWDNKALAESKFWQMIRGLAAAYLARKGISQNAPNPDGWYTVLPEELH